MVRFKNRYLLCEIQYDNESRIEQKDINLKQLRNEIFDSINQNYGELGASKAQSLQIKYWNCLTKIFIIRIARDYKDMIWSSLALMDQFQDKSAKIRIMHSSATIKKCELRAQRYLSLWVHQILQNKSVMKQVKEQIIQKFKEERQKLEQLDTQV